MNKWRYRHGYFYVTLYESKVVGFSESLYRVSQIRGSITSSQVNGNNWSTYLPSLTWEVFFTLSVTQWLWTWHPVFTWKSGDFQEIKSQLMQGHFERTSLGSLPKNSSEGESESKTNVKQIVFQCFPEVVLNIHTLTWMTSNPFLLSFLFTFQQHEFSLH